MKNITLDEALEDYLDRVVGGFGAKSTRVSNTTFLTRWRAWIIRDTHPQIHLVDIDDRMMDRFFKRIKPALNEGSYNNYRRYVNNFFKYCRGEGLITIDPMRHVGAQIVPEKPRLRLSPSELIELLDHAANPRDRAAMAIGMNTGLRAMDVMKLTVGCLDLRSNLLTVTMQKTGKADQLPVTSELRAEMLRWLDVYADWCGTTVERLPNSYILTPSLQCRRQLGGSYHLVPMPQNVHTRPAEIVQAALKKMDWPVKQEGFHTLRRSTGRALYDLAADDGINDPIRIAQALYRHSSRATTERYLGVTAERQLRDDMLKGKSFLQRAADVQTAKNADLDRGDDGLGGSLARVV